MTNKPSKETIKLIKGISKTLDIEMSDIKEMYNKFFESSPVQNLKVPNEQEREKHAVRILLANLTDERDRKEFSGKKVPVTIRIESKGAISDFKKAGNEIGYRSELFVTIQDEENIAIAKLTLWNDACEIHPNLLVGETYSTSVVIGNRGSIWETSMNEPSEIEESDVELKPMRDLITENFTPISISDAENNISKDRNDPKLVEGVVVSSWAKVTANNRDMGFLKIMEDFNFDTSILAKFSGDANCVNFVSAGDLVYVLGQITAATVNSDGSPEWPAGMWGELIIPILTVERTDTNAEEGTEEHEEEAADDSTLDEEDDSDNDDISGDIDGW